MCPDPGCAKPNLDGVETEPVDHKIRCGRYFNDPDGNGLEINCDTRKERDGEPLWGGQNRPLPYDKIMAALRD